MSQRNKKKSSGIPEKFIERLTEMFGVSLSSQIQQTFVERPTTFRVNTIKAERNEVRQILFDLGFKTDNVMWYKDAFILKNKSLRELQETDLYKTGKIYVQSLASMVPPLVLDPQAGERVLDLTAAPGSKTSQIAALVHCEGELVANDVDKVRFQKLQHNLELLGVVGGVVETHLGASLTRGLKTHQGVSANQETHQGASVQQGENNWQLILKNENGVPLAKEYPNYFDRVLLDAPCTAEARIILNQPATYSYWDEKNIKDTAYLQRQLLFSAWQMLKSGGVLVYSTCTFAPEEDELQITKFMDRNKDCDIENIEILNINKLPILKSWNGIEINKKVVKKALRIMPTREVEGFFVIKMRKASCHPKRSEA